jgi:hypothetical protein
VKLSSEYVAGFFDGEGCVNLTVKGRARQVALRVMVVNTEPMILALLHAQYGGRIPKPRQVGKETWKFFGVLVLTDYAAIRFLEDIAPFVILKKPQIELALEFWHFQHRPRRERCDILTGSHDYGGTRVVRKPETVQKELEFKARMHLLNQKGVA